MLNINNSNVSNSATAPRKYYLPSRPDRENPKKVILIECSKEIYYAIMPDIWKQIKQNSRAGLCACSLNMICYCDADCCLCRFRCKGRTVSMSDFLDSEEDITYEETIAAEEDTPEEIAIEDDLILKNPCDYVKLPKAEMQEMKFYTKEQIETLLEKIKGEEIADLVQITVGLGLRRSEMLGIKWDSIDFEHRTLTIKHTVCQIKERIESDTTKNRSSYRTFPLSDEMYQLFVDLKKKEEANAARYRSAYVRSDYVFKHENGVPFAPDFVSHKFKKLLEKYDLPRIRFHDLRHPYVKHTTKIFSLRLKVFQAQPVPDALRKTRGVFQYHR